MRVVADAFGPGLPVRTLMLSPDHAVYVDGVLIPIRYLVNGATICQDAVDTIAYHHVALAGHAVILAEGLPCESYLDTGNRDAFANGGGAIRMHADFAMGVWHARACAKLVLDGPELEAVRSYVLCQAAQLGHARTTSPDLHVLVEGQAVAPEVAGATYRFDLPANCNSVRLISRAAAPAWLQESGTDWRCLGVAVSRITRDGVALALDDVQLGAGWHDGEDGWRWTDGEPTLSLGGARVLELTLMRSLSYWLAHRNADARDRQAVSG